MIQTTNQIIVVDMNRMGSKQVEVYFTRGLGQPEDIGKTIAVWNTVRRGSKCGDKNMYFLFFKLGKGQNVFCQ